MTAIGTKLPSRIGWKVPVAEIGHYWVARVERCGQQVRVGGAERTPSRSVKRTPTTRTGLSLGAACRPTA